MLSLTSSGMEARVQALMFFLLRGMAVQKVAQPRRWFAGRDSRTRWGRSWAVGDNRWVGSTKCKVRKSHTCACEGRRCAVRSSALSRRWVQGLRGHWWGSQLGLGKCREWVETGRHCGSWREKEEYSEEEETSREEDKSARFDWACAYHAMAPYPMWVR